MDSLRFDALVRSLARPDHRRAALRQLAGALLAGGLVSAGSDVVFAACAPPGGKCHQNTDCCSQACKKRKHKCKNCPTGQKFCAVTNACIAADQCCGACPSGQTCCAPPGICVDTRTDKNHCGGCNNHMCSTADFCLNGQCAQSCGAALGCIQGCGCFSRVGASGKACGFNSFLNCNTPPTTCTKDADCGFGDACFDACPGLGGVCLKPCQ